MSTRFEHLLLVALEIEIEMGERVILDRLGRVAQRLENGLAGRDGDLAFRAPQLDDVAALDGGGLGPWAPLLRATRAACEAHAAMRQDPAFQRPLPYATLDALAFDALLRLEYLRLDAVLNFTIADDEVVRRLVVVKGLGEWPYDGLATWVFTRSNAVWSQKGARLRGADGVGPSAQGTSVALSAAGDTGAVITAAILHQAPASLSAARRDLPPALESVVMKALEKDRALRYQTAADIGADLKRLRRVSARSECLQSRGRHRRPAPWRVPWRVTPSSPATPRWPGCRVPAGCRGGPCRHGPG